MNPKTNDGNSQSSQQSNTTPNRTLSLWGSRDKVFSRLLDIDSALIVSRTPTNHQLKMRDGTYGSRGIYVMVEQLLDFSFANSYPMT